jgi:uncharacterized protein
LASALHDRAAARVHGQAGANDSTRELELLEPSGLIDLAKEHGQNKHQLDPAPIPADWVLEGVPVARVRLLSGSTDGKGSTVMWDCTAGRFNWFYDIDETVCLVQGSVMVKDAGGRVLHLKAGDTFYFAKGSRYEWTVERYVRKIAFIHVPMSQWTLQIRRLLKAIKRFVRPRAANAAAPSLFGEN